MPIPTPHADESQDDFIARCMSNDTMMSDYPEQDQRAAVCYQAWKDKDKDKHGADLLTVDSFRERGKLGIDRLPGAASARVFRVNLDQPKALDGSRAIRFCFSDGAVDRAGDRIDPNGWVLTDFLRNPVALWAHDSYSPPIGRATRVQVESSRLMGDIEFASAAAYPFADTIYELTKGGFINAVSVGFMPIEYSFVEDKDRPWGIDFKRQELLEISVCPVPCNQNALIEARSKGIDTRPLVEWAERCLDGGGKIVVPKAELEQLRKAAIPPPVSREHIRSMLFMPEEVLKQENFTPEERAKFLAALRKAKAASEDDPASGGALVATCGRDKDAECGLKNPAECAIHGPDYEDKTLSQRVETLVRNALKRALGKDAADGDAMPDDQRECVRSAYVHIKAAHEMHKDAVDLHDNGEHEAAMIMHRSIGAMHRKAIDDLEGIAKDADGENPEGDKPDGDKPEDDPEAKQARLRRVEQAREEARLLSAA